MRPSPDRRLLAALVATLLPGVPFLCPGQDGGTLDKLAGIAEPVDMAEAKTIVSGTIEYIHYEVGDTVEEGDILLEIDSDRYRYNYEMAKLRFEGKSNLRSAEAEVRVRAADVAKAQEDLRRRRIREEDMQGAEAKLEMSQAKLEGVREQEKANKLAMEYAELELEKRLIRAPEGGVITAIPKSLGQRANPGDTLAVIGDPTRVTVAFPVTKEIAKAMQEGRMVLMRSVVDNLLYEAQVLGVTNQGKDGQTAEVAIQPAQGAFRSPATPGEYILEPDSLEVQ